MSQIPPPLPLVVATVFSLVVVYLALFVPSALRWVPGMRWFKGLGPRASRFTAVVAASGVFAFGLHRLHILPTAVFEFGTFVWVLLMIAAASHDLGKALSTPEPAAPRPARKPIVVSRKDRRAEKRRSRRRGV